MTAPACIHPLSDHASTNPCAEVVSNDGIWYGDPSRPDHLLDALPADDASGQTLRRD